MSGGIYNDKESKLKKQRKKIKHEKLPDFDPGHVQCFFELTHGFPNAPEKAKNGTVVFEIFDSEVPLTAENFRVLCTGEKAQNLFY